MTRRALVLGGGGSAGNAWVIGVVAGLTESGLPVTDADLIIGTSSGSTAAVQITAVTPADLLSAIVSAPPLSPSPPRPDTGAPSGGVLRPGAVGDQLERTGRIIAAAHDAADMRRRMGAAARELAAAANHSDRWRSTVAARLPRLDWPDRAMLVPAVDAVTGDPVVFDRRSGVELADAVAASTSSGPAYRIGEHQYIDGGYRRNENVDLAEGHDRVLVLSPFAGRSRHPLEWGMHLATQVGELRAAGSQVRTVFPDDRALAAFGPTMMEPATRRPAAQAGFDQGRALADTLRDLWR